MKFDGFSVMKNQLFLNVVSGTWFSSQKFSLKRSEIELLTGFE